MRQLTSAEIDVVSGGYASRITGSTTSDVVASGIDGVANAGPSYSYVKYKLITPGLPRIPVPRHLIIRGREHRRPKQD
jgi:hypothetical protein